MTKKRASVHGVLVVDKPRGPTSHDVVARARRALGTREVGHCGTLDPMATGVLVLAIGEGTKLVPYLTAADKAYEATLRLGVETDSLDADGVVSREVAVPAGLTIARVREVAAQMVGTIAQRVPAVSAVKVDGERLFAKQRRGELVEAPVRDVELRSVRIAGLEANDITLSLECGKGFYVRAFARDLAAALGTVAHLTALRRTRSGAFTLDGAVEIGAIEPGRARSMLDAWGNGAAIVVTPEGRADALVGRAIAADRVARVSTEGGLDHPFAVVDEAGALLAIAIREPNQYRVVRGFRFD